MWVYPDSSGSKENRRSENQTRLPLNESGERVREPLVHARLHYGQKLGVCLVDDDPERVDSSDGIQWVVVDRAPGNSESPIAKRQLSCAPRRAPRGTTGLKGLFGAR